LRNVEGTCEQRMVAETRRMTPHYACLGAIRTWRQLHIQRQPVRHPPRCLLLYTAQLNPSSNPSTRSLTCLFSYFSSVLFTISLLELRPLFAPSTLPPLLRHLYLLATLHLLPRTPYGPINMPLGINNPLPSSMKSKIPSRSTPFSPQHEACSILTHSRQVNAGKRARFSPHSSIQTRLLAPTKSSLLRSSLGQRDLPS
jgi:hypothetical protein